MEKREAEGREMKEQRGSVGSSGPEELLEVMGVHWRGRHWG